MSSDVGSFYDVAIRRGQELTRLRARMADQRARIDELETALADRDNEIVDLRDDLAAAERRIDDLERDTWRPHH